MRGHNEWVSISYFENIDPNFITVVKYEFQKLLFISISILVYQDAVDGWFSRNFFSISNILHCLSSFFYFNL